MDTDTTNKDFRLYEEHIDVASFCSKPPERPVLQNVKVMKNKVVATDAIRIVEIKKDGDENSDDILLSGNAFMEIKKNLNKNSNFVVFSDKDDKCQAVFSDKSMKIVNLPCEKYDGNYPEYDLVFPTSEPKARISVNAKFLKELCAFIQKHSDNGNEMMIELHENEKPIVLRSFTKNGYEIRSALLPMRESHRMNTLYNSYYR